MRSIILFFSFILFNIYSDKFIFQIYQDELLMQSLSNKQNLSNKEILATNNINKDNFLKRIIWNKIALFFYGYFFGLNKDYIFIKIFQIFPLLWLLKKIKLYIFKNNDEENECKKSYN